MYAASLGWFANWTDTPSIPLSAWRSVNSAELRASSDTLFYRHFHGPLFHYFLIPVARALV